MARLLPRAFLAFVLVQVACSHESHPVAPGPPIRAEADVVVGTMDAECNGLATALEHYRACANLTSRQRDGISFLIDQTQLSLAAGHKANPDDKVQHAIAVSCRRAADSVAAATERCHNGPTPRMD
jgi:hypothetical protein